MQEPQTLTEAIRFFSDLDTCVQYLASKRWRSGVSCPTCGRTDVAFVPSRRLWQCKTRHPKAQFSVKTGTILEDSPLGLDKWLPVMWMVANCKNGVSSSEIHRSLGVTQKTAWFMLHRIRLGMQDDSPFKMPSSGGPVEVDETFIGGKARNMHKSKRDRLAREAGPGGLYGGNAKAIVIGMLQRGGRVKAQVIPARKRPIVHKVLQETIEKNAIVHTDEHNVYMGIDETYVHEIINHAETYARNYISTNGIENFWSLLKRGLGGTYVSVEPFHLFRYLDEQVFRFNNRATKDNPLNDSDRFDLLCSQIVGKRLTYAQLTAKEDKKSEVPF